jgi:nitrite reductase (NADH) small subunit
MTAQRHEAEWTDVCGVDDVGVERGVAALLDDVQVAIFRTFDGALFAVGNRDPFSGANVIARGIVGTRAGTSTVASPIFKQVFDLETGKCFDDPAVQLPVYAVRVNVGRVEVLR